MDLSCMDLSPTARIFWLGTGSGHVYVLCWALAFSLLALDHDGEPLGGRRRSSQRRRSEQCRFVLTRRIGPIPFLPCYRPVPGAGSLSLRPAPLSYPSDERALLEPFPRSHPRPFIRPGGRGWLRGKGGPFSLVSLSLPPLSACGCLHKGAHAGSSRWRGS